MSFEPEYLDGVAYFNRRDFFEAHEAWEEVWKRTTGRDKLFYKGLIHAAVALHHFGNGNLRGARKVIQSCLEYLEPYAPAYLGLDLNRLLIELRECFQEVLAAGENDGTVRLDESKIPSIAPPEAEA